jgi:hypothetical protein
LWKFELSSGDEVHSYTRGVLPDIGLSRHKIGEPKKLPFQLVLRLWSLGKSLALTANYTFGNRPSSKKKPLSHLRSSLGIERPQRGAVCTGVRVTRAGKDSAGSHCFLHPNGVAGAVLLGQQLPVQLSCIPQLSQLLRPS